VAEQHDGRRASTARTLNRDKVMRVWRLGNCDNFVGKREEIVFDAFSDSEPERAQDGSDMTGLREL